MRTMGRLPFFKRAEPVPLVPEATPEPAAPALPDNAWIRVLVVDDHDDVRDMLELSLLGDGFTVVGTAADAAQALEIVESQEVDIMLLDLHLTDSSGLDLLPEVRRASPATRVVILSAIGATMMTERAIAAGAVGFIEKGVSLRSIAMHLNRVATAPKTSLVRPFPLNRDYP